MLHQSLPHYILRKHFPSSADPWYTMPHLLHGRADLIGYFNSTCNHTSTPLVFIQTGFQRYNMPIVWFVLACALCQKSLSWSLSQSLSFCLTCYSSANHWFVFLVLPCTSVFKNIFLLSSSALCPPLLLTAA